MVSKHLPDATLEPIDLLDIALEDAWDKVLDAYDEKSALPDMVDLLDGADLSDSTQVAHTVIVNMLSEVMECIGRFSPWYTKPARTFGLLSRLDRKNNRYQWILAPEAIHQWNDHISSIRRAVDKNIGLIQATLLVGGLATEAVDEKSSVTAYCSCTPPRAIHLTFSAFKECEVICEACEHPFG